VLLPFLVPATAATPGDLLPEQKPASIRFNRDIRPVLSDTCFHCHGFDAGKRKANQRLDTGEGATAVQNGRQAVKPGDLQASELWRRVATTNASLRMPPPDSGKKLSAAQVTLLREWIEQGAPYEKHWAFQPPERPAPPSIKRGDWPRNEVDRFILARLESLQLSPSPEAPRSTLIRRVTLDLTGLPPTLEEVDAFLADEEPGAYQRLVDRLLASPRYGEQMARSWLDVARYGDTHGLHLDNERSLWPYRDWVVDAFNRNLPFDQFTIEQLAGDLLPNATRAQKIASGFNRCNVSTSEGGAIDEEFQVRYAVDRVETTSTTWMGLTMGCAVCHDHKLDPITQKEFYQVFSIFNNLAENAMDGNALLPPPTLKLPTPEQQKALDDYAAQIAGLEKKLRETVAALKYVDPAGLSNAPAPSPKELVWVDDDFPPKAVAKVNDGNQSNKWVTAGHGPVFSGQRSLQRAGTNIHQGFFEETSEPLTVSAGDRLFAHVYLDPTNAPKAVMLQYRVGDKWSKRANWGDEEVIDYGKKGTTERVQAGPLPEKGKWVRLEIEAARLGLRPGTRISGMAFTQHGGNAWWDKAGLVVVNDPAQNPDLSLLAWQKFERGLGDESALPQELKDLLKKEPAKLDEKQQVKLRGYFLDNIYADAGSTLRPIREDLKSSGEKREAVDREIPATMIAKELEKPRPAWLLVRGQYDKHGDPVGPGVPAVLPPLPPAEVTNRLTFARWLVNTNHPLTARVTVNRLWQQFFGTGLVKTSEDFGAKGEWPSHPELLDWLATEFMRTGWDVRQFVRMLVSSSTYRQASSVTPRLRELDPENRLLARGPRYRLDAEVLRDNALYLGGLLNEKRGGRGVRPYQPPGIWEAVGYTTSNTAKYSQDKGDALYRRSLYIFWKRTAPPPSMTTFDAPSRESCTARRERTNTPLQALVTMNDPQFFEAARHLGHRMICQGGRTDADRLRFGFRLVTARPPSAEESAVLTQALEAQRARYTPDLDAARKVIAVGESPVPADAAPAELAAYTLVASLLLNLDEAITKH
jgi:hypothetical protein